MGSEKAPPVRERWGEVRLQTSQLNRYPNGSLPRGGGQQTHRTALPPRKNQTPFTYT